MIYFLLLLTLYTWPFGQLLTLSIPGVNFTIYLLDIFTFLILISLIISARRKEIFSGPIFKPLSIFLVLATLSFIINLQQGITSGILLSFLYLLRLISYSALFFAAREIGPDRLKKPILISLCIFLILCLSQYLFFPDMRYLKLLGFDDHYFRLIGSFYDPNFTGAVLAGISLYFVGKNKIIYSVPSIGLLALTFSRASYLVFGLGLIYLLITNKKSKILLLLFLLGLVVYIIPKPFGEGVNLLRTFSIFSRFESWKQGIDLFLQRPILGWGYNNLRGINGSRFQIDNSFIYLLATTGALGFLAFCNLLIKINKNIKDNALRILVIALLLHSLFNNTLFYIWITAMFWFSLGFSGKEIKEYKKF